MMKKLDKRLFFSMTKDFFDIYIPQDGDSGKTVKAYRDSLTVFRRYVLEEKGLSVSKFTFTECTFDFVLEYRNWLLDNQHKAKSTVNNRIAAIKSYLRYAAAKDIMVQQIQLNVAEVPFLREPKKIRPIIEDKDSLKALLNSPPNTKLGCRDVMILSVLFDTMIRASELISLDIKDIHVNSGEPYLFIHGKGNKERIVSLSNETIPLIKSYMEEFHQECEDYSHPFIYTVQHETVHRMSERNLERIVKKYADIVRETHPNIPPSCYPHMFRRTRGTGLYRDGVAIEAIAIAMGHANIQTTKDHYAFSSLEQKREAMEQGGGTVITEKEDRKWPDDEDEIARICGLR